MKIYLLKYVQPLICFVNSKKSKLTETLIILNTRSFLLYNERRTYATFIMVYCVIAFIICNYQSQIYILVGCCLRHWLCSCCNIKKGLLVKVDDPL